jgi:hypothetical protein
MFKPARLVALAIVFLIVFCFCPTASAQTPDFTMNESFLRRLIQEDAAQITLSVRMDDNGPLHQLGSDCEMHIAGRVQNASLGNPPSIVVEFPNWCKFSPDGQLGSSFNTLSSLWRNLVDNRVVGKTCDVRGFLRIFTEHVSGGGGPTNPDHAYEFHPALSMTCDGEAFNFDSMLSAFPGMRHIQPSTAADCINGRELYVRWKNNRYEFRQGGGGSCGNFAIVEVRDIDLEWSFEMPGGHYTFATVTANGQTQSSIGVYTLTGSAADQWLAGAIQQGGVGQTRKVLHGMFTYDFQSIIVTLTDEQGNLLRPSLWKKVDFPLALVIFGETSEIPWQH